MPVCVQMHGAIFRKPKILCQEPVVYYFCVTKFDLTAHGPVLDFSHLIFIDRRAKLKRKIFSGLALFLVFGLAVPLFGQTYDPMKFRLFADLSG